MGQEATFASALCTRKNARVQGSKTGGTGGGGVGGFGVGGVWFVGGVWEIGGWEGERGGWCENLEFRDMRSGSVPNVEASDLAILKSERRAHHRLVVHCARALDGAPAKACASRSRGRTSTAAVRGNPRHHSLSRWRARGQRRACEIDLRGARPAPRLVRRSVWNGRSPAPTSMVCCGMDGEGSGGMMLGPSRPAASYLPVWSVTTHRLDTRADK